MMSSTGGQTRTIKPELIAFGLFALFATLLWFVHTPLTRLLLGVSATEVVGYELTYLFVRADTIIFALVTSIAGLVCYLALTQYALTHRAQSLAEDMLGDISLSREQFRMLYENSPVPYFLMDDQGSIHDTNKATWRFFGGTKQECELINFFERIEHSGAHSNVATILRSKVERGLPISNVEMSIQALEGSSRWVLVSIYSLARTTTLPFRHLVTLIDITKEKEHEQVKSDFLLLASHQLRTPMTTIKWYTDYLLNTPSIEMNGIVREYLSEIEHGNERMIELVNTLLTVSRLEMGTLSPEYTPVHVQEIMRDIFKELTPDAKKRSIDIRLVTNGDDKLVTDRSMLRIVLHNLLTNAIKYSQLGGTVLVTSEFTASGCTIAVSDSGCGIPLAEQDKIFSKMYRASNAKKVSASGTGLGLHLTRSFMAKLGGSIDFTSVEGQGSTFTLQLPRVAPEA